MTGSDLGFFGPAHFFNNFAAVEGGAVVMLDESVVRSNEPMVFENNSARDGGALHGLDSSLTVLGGTVWRHNQAGGYGGGLRMLSSTVELIGGSEFEGNAAGLDGGAVQFVSVESLAVRDARFSSNSAGSNGGAMSMMSVGTAANTLAGETISGSATMVFCWFAENEAGGLGGAVHIVGGYAAILDSEFHNSTAGKFATFSTTTWHITSPRIQFSH